jgi:hypothetical protein
MRDNNEIYPGGKDFYKNRKVYIQEASFTGRYSLRMHRDFLY